MRKIFVLILAAALFMTAAICCASADGEWADYTCEEQQFFTKIPVNGTSGYDDGVKGLMIYTEVPGYIPYVIVKRRPMDMKFNNPEDYLNNVYREYLEDKYGENSRGMNPATTWEIGGKQLTGARYMYRIGEYDVVQLQMIEIRDAGDVEYTAKFIEGKDEATLAALNEAVRNYRETDTEASEPAETWEDGKEVAQAEVPFFMTPGVFTEYYNAVMEELADRYAEQLGEEGVRIVREQYTMTQSDPDGAIIYYGNDDWSVEAGFMYADAASASDTSPALLLNFTIKEGVPDGAVYLSKYAFRMMIAYAYRDEVSTGELADWFENAKDSADIFTLPGYMLNVLKNGGQVQYAVLPPASQIPQLQDTQP